LRSSSPTSRLVRLAREWSRTCTFSSERDIKIHGSIGIGFNIFDLKAEAERLVKKNYSTTFEERENFTEEVTLNIAQHTKSEVIFYWKEVRQKGVARFSEGDFEVEIPYEVVVGPTFDQEQIDVN
jgi:hypothetical protein